MNHMKTTTFKAFDAASRVDALSYGVVDLGSRYERNGSRSYDVHHGDMVTTITVDDREIEIDEYGSANIVLIDTDEQGQPYRDLNATHVTFSVARPLREEDLQR